MDAEMERDFQEADRLMAEVDRLQGPSPLKDKLRRLGRSDVTRIVYAQSEA